MPFEMFDVNGQVLIFEPILYDRDIYMTYKIQDQNFIQISYSCYFYKVELFEFIANLEKIQQYSSQIFSMKSLVEEEFICNFSAPNSDLVIEINLMKYSSYQGAKDTTVQIVLVIPFEYKSAIIHKFKMLKNQIIALKQSQ